MFNLVYIDFFLNLAFLFMGYPLFDLFGVPLDILGSLFSMDFDSLSFAVTDGAKPAVDVTRPVVDSTDSSNRSYNIFMLSLAGALAAALVGTIGYRLFNITRDRPPGDGVGALSRSVSTDSGIAIHATAADSFARAPRADPDNYLDNLPHIGVPGNKPPRNDDDAAAV